MASTLHYVQQGECLSSIAENHGIPARLIWNASENAELRRKRENPNILLPGDAVAIPDKQLAEVSRPPEKRHRFRLKREPVTLRLRVLDDGKPRANEPYILSIGSVRINGETDGDGRLDEMIPPGETRAVLRLGRDRDATDYVLNLGHMDPLNETTGGQARLKNLGYYAGMIDGIAGKLTTQALRRFQQDHSLTVTGKFDERTLEKLKAEHGS